MKDCAFFKPVDVTGLSSSEDSYDPPSASSPSLIFRENLEVDNAPRNAAAPAVPFLVRRANPIKERSSGSIGDDDEYPSRVISPHPFDPEAGQRQDHDGLTSSVSREWTAVVDGPVRGGGSLKRARDDAEVSMEPDYSRFFEFHPSAPSSPRELGVGGMECDDFSISSYEADSLSENFSFGGISRDPSHFWDEAIDRAGSTASNEDRSSPAQVSLLSEHNTTTKDPDTVASAVRNDSGDRDHVGSS